MSYNTIGVVTAWDADDIRDNCGGFAYDLTDDQMDEVIAKLGDWFNTNPTDEELDEFFRYEGDTIAEWLNFKDEEHLQFALDNVNHRIYYDREDGSYCTDDELDDRFEDFKKVCEENGEEVEYTDWEDWASTFCDEVESAME